MSSLTPVVAAIDTSGITDLGAQVVTVIGVIGGAIAVVGAAYLGFIVAKNAVLKFGPALLNKFTSRA